ncbi:MAG: arylsulfotransferase family protein [Candidatus Eisenbacteria bacterium]
MTAAQRQRAGGRRRPLRFVVLVVLVFVCGFVYGWPTGRRGVFPYPQLAAARSLLSGRGSTTASDAVPGRFRAWRADDRPSGLSDDQRAEVERLMALGHTSGSRPTPAVAGVTAHDRESALPGVNLIVSGHGPVALLVDMEGRVLHRWSYDFFDVWPDASGARDDRDAQFWRRAHVFPNGDLLAIYDRLGLVKLDARSNLLWSYPGACHHDLCVTEDGLIYALEQEAGVISRFSENRPVLVDCVSVLSPDGRLLRRVSLLEAFERSPYAPLLQRTPEAGDVFHTNTIEVLDGSLAHVSPAFRAGNVLLCVRNIEAVVVVDMESEEVVWALTGRWSRQHQPTVLGNGHLMVFNNEAGPVAAGGAPTGPRGSSVVELDPFTQTTFWTYSGTAGRPLYSETCGSCQRLPNGNTLITESDNGRALEVTPGGTIVWEFVSPFRAGEDGELIATLLEAVRLPESFGAGWLGEGM